MINKQLTMRLGAGMFSALIAIAAPATLAAAPASAPYTESRPSAALAPYHTELFNLLMNRKNIIDNKNYYQKEFGLAFDALLAQSALAQAAPKTPPLKKRLLSGPAPDAQFLTDKTSGKQYFYYEACQAHACDESNLALLYEPVAKTMSARLVLDKKEEYLGNPTAEQKKLFESLKNQP